MIKSLNEIGSFFLELAMLAAFAYAGFQVGSDQWQHYLFGICVPACVIIFWWKRMAPKARQRLSYPWLLIVTFLLFEAAAGALYFAGISKWAILLAVASLINVGLKFTFKIRRL